MRLAHPSAIAKGLDSWSRLVSADLLLCALVWDFLVFLIVI